MVINEAEAKLGNGGIFSTRQFMNNHIHWVWPSVTVAVAKKDLYSGIPY